VIPTEKSLKDNNKKRLLFYKVTLSAFQTLTGFIVFDCRYPLRGYFVNIGTIELTSRDMIKIIFILQK
jgi:hypothetical protein